MQKIMIIGVLCVSTSMMATDSGRCHVATLFGLITQQERVMQALEDVQRKNLQLVKDIQKKISKLSVHQYRQAYECEKIAACQHDQIYRQDYLEDEVLQMVKDNVEALHEHVTFLESELRRSYIQNEHEEGRYKKYVEKRLDMLAGAFDELGQDSEDKIMAMELRLADLERHICARNVSPFFSAVLGSNQSSGFENISLSESSSADEDSPLYAQVNFRGNLYQELEPLRITE